MSRYERRSTEAPMDFEFTSPRRELPPDSPFRRGIEAAQKRTRLKHEPSLSGLTCLSRFSLPNGVLACPHVQPAADILVWR
jgi:hypothetical protein